MAIQFKTEHIVHHFNIIDLQDDRLGWVSKDELITFLQPAEVKDIMVKHLRADSYEIKIIKDDQLKRLREIIKNIPKNIDELTLFTFRLTKSLLEHYEPKRRKLLIREFRMKKRTGTFILMDDLKKIVRKDKISPSIITKCCKITTNDLVSRTDYITAHDFNEQVCDKEIQVKKKVKIIKYWDAINIINYLQAHIEEINTSKRIKRFNNLTSVIKMKKSTSKRKRKDDDEEKKKKEELDVNVDEKPFFEEYSGYDSDKESLVDLTPDLDPEEETVSHQSMLTEQSILDVLEDLFMEEKDDPELKKLFNPTKLLKMKKKDIIDGKMEGFEIWCMFYGYMREKYLGLGSYHSIPKSEHLSIKDKIRRHLNS